MPKDDLRLLRIARAMSFKTIEIEGVFVQYITVGEALKFIGIPNGIPLLTVKD